MVRQLFLLIAILATLGLASEPGRTFGFGTGPSEPVSALVMGTVLLLLAAVARRAPVRKG